MYVSTVLFFEPQLASQLKYTALAEMRQVIKLFQEVFLAFHKYDNSVSYVKWIIKGI